MYNFVFFFFFLNSAMGQSASAVINSRRSQQQQQQHRGKNHEGSSSNDASKAAAVRMTSYYIEANNNNNNEFHGKLTEQVSTTSAASMSRMTAEQRLLSLEQELRMSRQENLALQVQFSVTKPLGTKLQWFSVGP